MRSILLAFAFTVACCLAIIGPSLSPLSNSVAEPVSLPVAVEPVAEPPNTRETEGEVLRRNAERAANERADANARRRAIIQERATAAAARRRERLIAVENQPRRNPWATSTAGARRPIVYWDSPNWRPRDVDVILIEE